MISVKELLITSSTNPIVKELVRLKDGKGERSEAEFLVEGRREIERAIANNFDLTDLYICPEICDSPQEGIVKNARRSTTMSWPAFSKIVVRERSDGLIAVFCRRSLSFADLAPKMTGKTPLILALEDVEKPGNLGAVLRTADAAGVNAVIVLNQTIDPWNGNVIRSSLGGVFTVPVIAATNEEFLAWCHEQNITVVAAALSENAKSIYETKLHAATAIVLGSEAKGLSEFWMKASDHIAMIPMAGICDSLNISVAAALFAFEAVRQRLVKS